MPHDPPSIRVPSYSQLRDEVARLREVLRWCCDCPTPERRWEEANKLLKPEADDGN